MNLIKGAVSVISSDPSCKDGNPRFKDLFLSLGFKVIIPLYFPAEMRKPIL